MLDGEAGKHLLRNQDLKTIPTIFQETRSSLRDKQKEAILGVSQSSFFAVFPVFQ